ncbi:MAG: sigma-54-dependent Fis family transcriptional regulator [Candidatus Riflebacteria bacterium]|nr:sigma-54-dependent Fis family transcriptional regulator [Candidatus Riflebacteria bacterium]
MPDTPRILIVDDDEVARSGLRLAFAKSNFKIELAEDGPRALQLLEQTDFDVVLIDYKMPKMDGLELIRHILERKPFIKVLMITGRGTIETAVEAMKLGAADFVTKPFDVEELRAKVQKALAEKRLLEENLYLKRELAARITSESGLIWQDDKMKEILALVAKSAPTSNSVLIEGESGTGKELVARSIHDQSLRKSKKFLAINCAAFSEDLLQDALFGHEKGAFTGADSRKPGIFEAAEGGTIFMDEIGDLPAAMQAAFLRVIQEHELFRLGGREPVSVDFRLIAATNQNLHKMVEEGRFRKDLYYRIRVNYIKIPPLRDRFSDIPVLANFFLKKYATVENRPVESFHKEVLRTFAGYDWPGNVRELENVIKQMVVLTDKRILSMDDVPGIILEALRERSEYSTLEDLKRDHIKSVLRSVQGNRTQAAKILGIPRVSLQRIISRDPELASIRVLGSTGGPDDEDS